jgi:hypothetical protein
MGSSCFEQQDENTSAEVAKGIAPHRSAGSLPGIGTGVSSSYQLPRTRTPAAAMIACSIKCSPGEGAGVYKFEEILPN